MNDETTKSIEQIIKAMEDCNPINIIVNKEFDDFLMEFSTLLFLLYNKNVNSTFLFTTLIKNDELRHVFQTMINITSFYECLDLVLKRHPNLVKSKLAKQAKLKKPKTLTTKQKCQK